MYAIIAMPLAWRRQSLGASLCERWELRGWLSLVHSLEVPAWGQAVFRES